MKAEDIKSADDLGAWLNGLPKDLISQVAPQIAHRAAMRVLPVWAAYWSNFENEVISGVSVFRCHLLCAVALHDRNADFDYELFKAQSVWQPAASHALTSFKHVSSRDHQHALSEVSAYFAKAASQAAEHAGHAVSIVRRTYRREANIIFSAAKLGAAESALTADIVAWESGKTVSDRPLFLPERDVMQRIWTDAAPLFERHPAWAVFKELYENTLHARPQNWPLLIALAQKDAAFWTGKDEEVLDRIAGVMEEFEGPKPSSVEEEASPDQIINRAMQKQTASTASEIAHVKKAIGVVRSELPANFDAVLGLIALEIERLQRTNYVSEEHREICVQQIRTLTVIHRAIERLRDAVPEGAVEDKDAEKILSLGRVFAAHCKAWPRNNAEEMVDTTFRLGLVGGLSGLLVGIGVPVAVGAGICAAALFGKQTVQVLVENRQSK